MLSTKLHNALNAQVNAELWSAYLYLAMSLDAEAKGHKGVANWFYVQFQEEQALFLKPVFVFPYLFFKVDNLAYCISHRRHRFAGVVRHSAIVRADTSGHTAHSFNTLLLGIDVAFKP